MSNNNFQQLCAVRYCFKGTVQGKLRLGCLGSVMVFSEGKVSIEDLSFS